MKPGKPIIGLGVIVIVSGMIFSFQGLSIIGPESSFMYSNPEWITNGQWITIIGIIILAVGFIMFKISLQRPK